MPFLRETPRSLRAYFLLVGVLATLGGIGAVANAVSNRHLASEAFAIAPVLLYGLDLLYAGLRFHPLLETRPERLEQIVYASIGAVVLQVFVDFAAKLDIGAMFARAGLGLAISLYLLANVRRLAREATKNA